MPKLECSSTTDKTCSKQGFEHRMLSCLLDLSKEAIFAWELNGSIVYWNKGAEMLYGYSSQEAVGCLSHDLLKTVHPSEFSNIKVLLERDGLWNGVIEHTCKNGEKLIIETSHQVILNEFDEPIVLETNRDITEKKRAEKALKNAYQFTNEILESINDGFFSLNREWKFTYVNQRAAKNVGFKRFELLNQSIWDNFVGIRGSIMESNFRKVMSERIPCHFEYDGLITDESYHISVYPAIDGISVYWIDVTEQKLAEQKLTKSQEQLESILENMSDCFCALNYDWEITYTNRSAEVAFGRAREEYIGKKLTDVMKINESAHNHYKEVINEKKSVNFEILSEAFDNRWLDVSAYPTENGIAIYFRDVTSSKIAEETLRQSEEKFSKSFHVGPFMMTLSTVNEGVILDANEAFCSGTGYTREEIVGRTSNELNFFVDIPKRQELGKILTEHGKVENAELDIRTKSGEIRHVYIWSQTFYLAGVNCHITGIIDVTEQRRLQKEMARLDRLSLVGQMAAGIAHEIRNPMTTVRGYLQLLSAKPDYEAYKSTFELMISEIDRANSIITEFLSLAQPNQTKLNLENLNDILLNLYPLIEADTFTQNKQINFILSEIPNLKLNPKEISQLVLNLTRNGLDAMREGGTLTIKSYSKDDTVVLEISDEGCGIPRENLDKLGIPFFTTKDSGTGLGLAICYRIAESHDAKMQIVSSPKGTTFFVNFPIPYKVEF
ncbi:PAS domain-containing sensor histidine kinase [Desulfosporosinus sp. FKA]|uniref:PAS domain-containing sensor histidine kinase n=1 Tax=Desulfosporosinus sp. FKA TaxID=1969834 RepID=UPI000B4A3249|nr:PAS domain-containing sensor histidine kinase [Desulfosporosinus sp. FKA]